MTTQSSERESGKLVLPGECIGVIEEFIPDTGTFVKDGVIYSSMVGRTLLDFLNKRVSVYPLVDRMKIPNVGNTVMGQVVHVQKQNAHVKIFEINGNHLSKSFGSLLHISDVQSMYVESMYDICKPTDIIKAEVVSKNNGIYHLSTKGKNLGVVHAFCSTCGHILEQRQKRMHCNQCGTVEKRKMASGQTKENSSREGDKR
ncbi:MAG: exosome complex RNA-binding protein Csl4 [Candidatus Bathyarchaeota archaeon]|jgi:exosome complex component CSL4